MKEEPIQNPLYPPKGTEGNVESPRGAEGNSSVHRQAAGGTFRRLKKWDTLLMLLTEMAIACLWFRV